MNRSFYQIYSKGLLAYNKKTIDKKENSFYIYNNNNSNSNEKNKEINVNNEKKDKDQKIIQSLQLLISTLSLDGLKEVQNEVQKLLSSKMK